MKKMKVNAATVMGVRKTPTMDLETLNQERFSGRIFTLTGRKRRQRTSIPLSYQCDVCHPEKDRYFYGNEEEEERKIHPIHQNPTRKPYISSHRHHLHHYSQMNIFRRVAVFFSLIVYVLVFALVLTGLITDYWISTTSLERNEKVLLSSSFVHGGLFFGERQLDWGLGPSHQYFSVYDEITQKVGYMNKVLWILVISFIALGLFWSFIGLMVALLNTVAKERKTILGPSGIHLWSLLSICSYSAAIFIYLLQYYSTIQKNVLLPDQLNAGFSSTNRTQLAFSFYLIVAAIGSLFIPMSLLCASNLLQPRPKTKVIPIDTTVFMY